MSASEVFLRVVLMGQPVMEQSKSTTHPVEERRLHNINKYYIPSMHGPWYAGHWCEEVTEQIGEYTCVSVYNIVRGERKLSFRVCG